MVLQQVWFGLFRLGLFGLGLVNACLLFLLFFVLFLTTIPHHQESRMEIHSGVSREYVHSVQFPMDKAALSAIEQVKSGSLNVIQLQVDAEKETIDFVKVCWCLCSC